MAVPWLRVLNAVLGINEIARIVKGRPPPPTIPISWRSANAEVRSRRAWQAWWSLR